MLLTFSISKGQLQLGDYSPDNAPMSAYSGAPGFVNDPLKALDIEAMIGKGPIPPGLYWIGAPITHPHLGPVAIPLTPAAHMLRGGFYIHGDNAKMNQSASEGCIIAQLFARRSIANSGAKILSVKI